MVMVSGFRSYATQVDTYNHWVLQHGSEAAADMISARPGYSEHQTGLSLDIGDSTGAATCSVPSRHCQPAARSRPTMPCGSGSSSATRRGRNVTGYSPEPWHLRYVGKKVARTTAPIRNIHSLEEYFGLPPAPRYP